MPADLDQLGRQYSHGTVIGGKGLVELGHVASDARRFLDQVNLKTGSGKIERSLDAADASTDNHDVTKIAVCGTFKKSFNLLFFHFTGSLSVFSMGCASLHPPYITSEMISVMSLISMTSLSSRFNLLSSKFVMQYGQAVAST